jgi:type II secretory pathway component GspD/PulD (secretin)
MASQPAVWRNVASLFILAACMSSALSQAPVKKPPAEKNLDRIAPTNSEPQVTLEVLLAEIQLNSENGLGVEGVETCPRCPVRFTRSNTGSLVFTSDGDTVERFFRALNASGQINMRIPSRIVTSDDLPALIQLGQDADAFIRTDWKHTTITRIGPYSNKDMDLRCASGVLEVTPKNTRDGNLVMRLITEVSSITISCAHGTYTSLKNIPVQRLEAMVAVADGATVVLGGKINQRPVSTECKVPWLADLPGVGCLFRFSTQAMERTQLLVFVTPHVVHNRKDVDRFLGKGE